MRRRRIAWLASAAWVGAVFGAAVVASGACRGATYATVVIDARSIGCAELRDVDVSVAGDGAAVEANAARGFYALTTRSCTGDGDVGSVVVTPGPTDRAAIAVVAGITADANSCRPPDFAGCVVARRAFAFLDGVGLTIPISLDVSCVGIPCDALSTCEHGACVSSAVTCADDGTCASPGAAPSSPEAGAREDADTVDAAEAGAEQEAGAGDGGAAQTNGCPVGPGEVVDCRAATKSGVCDESDGGVSCTTTPAGYYFTCTGALHCPSGQLCCAYDTDAGGEPARVSSCADPRTCETGGYVLCGAPADCPMGETCAGAYPLESVGGFSYCE